MSTVWSRLVAAWVASSVEERRRWAVRAEAAVAGALGACVVLWFATRSAVLGGLQAAAEGAWAARELLAVDRAATRALCISTLVRAALVFGPAVALLARAPRHRIAWVVPASVPAMVELGMLPASISTPLMWKLLVGASVVAFVAVAMRRLTWLVALPIVVGGQALVGHGPPRDTAWPPDKLFARCTKNDGERPRSLRPEHATLRYYSVTRFAPDVLLLTGERTSWWLRRGADGKFDIERESMAHGALWPGAVVGDAIWFAEKYPDILRVTRHPGQDERVELWPVAPPWRPFAFSNFEDPVFDPALGKLYLSANIGGAIREYDPEKNTLDDIYVGGLNPHIARRADGMIVGATTSTVFVLDPARGEVLQRTAGGLAMVGASLCRATAELATADITGRLRIFAPDASGKYGFARGVDLAAPRRVAFSPTCDRLAIGSADDETVTLLDARTLATQRTFRVGPALRDVSWLDDGTVVAVDGCGANFLSTSR